MRTLALGLILLLVAPALAGPQRTHTAVLETPHFEVRYRPGSRAGAVAESSGAAAEQALVRICDALGVKNDGKYKLYLYDHVAELQASNKNTAAGFAWEDQVHVPIDNLQTLAHEIAHVVTYRLPKSGDETRNMFFVEGIANALLQYVHGVPVHAVAKYYRETKRMPSLAEMIGVKDFYAWMRTRPGLNVYDVGASFMRHLIDAYGMPTVLRYYTGTSAKKAFGKPPAALEKAWHRTLDAFELRPEVLTLLRLRHGESGGFVDSDMPAFDRLPPEIRGKRAEWDQLIGKQLQPVTKGDWKRKGKLIEGATKSGVWSWCAVGTKKVGDAVLTATLRPSPGCTGVAVRFGDDVWALLTRGGAYLYTKDNVTKGGSKEGRLGDDTVELTLVRTGSSIRIYVDGYLVYASRLASKKSVPAVGVVAGRVVVESLRVREL